MLISHSHAFIYMKTLKTAGTSVEIYFQNACLPPTYPPIHTHEVQETVTVAGIIGRRLGQPGMTWYNHMSAKVICAEVGERIWNRYFKFCVVRNPFDKLVPYWWMYRTPEERQCFQETGFSLIRSEFSRWVLASAYTIVDRDKYLIDGAICVDYFIRFECLLEGIKEVCQFVDVPFEPGRLGSFKGHYRADRRHFSDYYDPEAAHIVEEAFAWELQHFGYTLSP